MPFTSWIADAFANPGSCRALLKSPVPLLLRSNDPPTAREILLIHNAINKVEESLQSDMDDLCSTRFHDFINSHKAIFSPWRKLPTELLVEIFLFCVDEYDDSVHDKPPWVLGQICRPWRRVALSTCGLWKKLPSVNLGKSKKSEIKQQLAWISELIQRSGNAPISFSLPETRVPPLNDSALHLLFRHAERWEHVHLTVDEHICEQLSLIKTPFISLRSLRLSIFTPNQRLVVDVFQSAPKLQRVSLSTGLEPDLVKIPWQQLTSFTELSGNLYHLASALTSPSSHRLRELCFYETQGFGDLGQLELPNLTSLVVQSKTGLGSFFDVLNAPALQEMVVRLFCTDPLVVQKLIDMLSRCSCVLRRLVLHTNYQGNIPIRGLLTSTPQLISLDINHPTTDLLNVLIITSTMNPRKWAFLPCLESLTLRLWSAYPHLSDLVRFAQTRCDPHTDKNSNNGDSEPFPLRLFKLAPPPETWRLGFQTPRFGIRFEAWSQWTGPENPKEKLTGQLLDMKQSLNNAVDAVQIASEIPIKERPFQLACRIDTLLTLLEDIQITPESVIHFYVSQ